MELYPSVRALRSIGYFFVATGIFGFKAVNLFVPRSGPLCGMKRHFAAAAPIVAYMITSHFLLTVSRQKLQ